MSFDDSSSQWQRIQRVYEMHDHFADMDDDLHDYTDFQAVWVSVRNQRQKVEKDVAFEFSEENEERKMVVKDRKTGKSVVEISPHDIKALRAIMHDLTQDSEKISIFRLLFK